MIRGIVAYLFEPPSTFAYSSKFWITDTFVVVLILLFLFPVQVTTKRHESNKKRFLQLVLEFFAVREQRFLWPNLA